MSTFVVSTVYIDSPGNLRSWDISRSGNNHTETMYKYTNKKLWYDEFQFLVVSITDISIIQLHFPGKQVRHELQFHVK